MQLTLTRIFHESGSFIGKASGGAACILV